jgi:hypothetical protein
MIEIVAVTEWIEGHRMRGDNQGGYRFFGTGY